MRSTNRTLRRHRVPRRSPALAAAAVAAAAQPLAAAAQPLAAATIALSAIVSHTMGGAYSRLFGRFQMTPGDEIELTPPAPDASAEPDGPDAPAPAPPAIAAPTMTPFDATMDAYKRDLLAENKDSLEPKLLVARRDNDRLRMKCSPQVRLQFEPRGRKNVLDMTVEELATELVNLKYEDERLDSLYRRRVREVTQLSHDYCDACLRACLVVIVLVVLAVIIDHFV